MMLVMKMDRRLKPTCETGTMANHTIERGAGFDLLEKLLQVWKMAICRHRKIRSDDPK